MLSTTGNHPVCPIGEASTRTLPDLCKDDHPAGYRRSHSSPKRENPSARPEWRGCLGSSAAAFRHGTTRRSSHLRSLSLLLVLWPTPVRGQNDVTIVRPKLATVVYDRRGGLLGEVGSETRTWVSLSDLPRIVGQAFVATEDRRFYQHNGVDVIGILGAVRDNVLHGLGTRGASTISQQLIGAMYPTEVNRRERTIGRKLREAEMARALERRNSKAQILEAYLNYINFGHGWYGIESAARHYFGVHASALRLAQVALLAALPNAPAHYDPRAYPDRAMARRALVLQRMRDEEYITPQAAAAAQTEPLELAADDGYSARAPWIVEWVRQWLSERVGLATVNAGGLAVYTTVDPAVQQAAHASLVAGLARVESLPGYRWPRFRTLGAAPDSAGSTPYLQGLLVALEPHTGDVLALEGGREFRDSQFDRARLAMRQPGSAFKPFVYATALARGIPPTALVPNAPFTLRGDDGAMWTPENSDGEWSGPVTMRTALVRSLNVPTIRLAMEAGVDSVVALARRFGLTTSLPAVPSVAIGSAEVRPLELIAAYGAFANLGSLASPRLVTAVRGPDGSSIYAVPMVQRQVVLDSRVAFQVVDILQDAVRTGTGAAALHGLPSTLSVAGKTGTTNDNADAWFVGFTPNLVAGVWLGFDKRHTIAATAYGGTLAAPIWAEFATLVYARRPTPAPWQPPAGLSALRVRRADGRPMLGDTTDLSCTEYFLRGTPTSASESRAARLLRRLRQLLSTP